jgi:hypothetical protein
MSTQPTDTPRPLNAENLLGDKPLGLPMPEPITVRPQLPDVERIRANCAEQIRRLDELTRPVSTADVASLARELGEHYAGGDDGPIREPGDDMPSDSDVYSDEELCQALERHRNSAARMGRYDMASDLRMVCDRLEALIGIEAELARAVKQVQDLAAEKRQAQDWIANLRRTNELYAQRIAEQNALLAQFAENGK